MGGPNLCPTTPHPITGETVPLTFGHEFSAIVTEVGEGVKDFKEGDRVAVEVCIERNGALRRSRLLSRRGVANVAGSSPVPALELN